MTWGLALGVANMIQLPFGKVLYNFVSMNETDIGSWVSRNHIEIEMDQK